MDLRIPWLALAVWPAFPVPVAAQCATPWSALGAGTDGVVNALAVLPNGEWIAGGSFTLAGGVPAACIARWDGQTWHALGTGMSGTTAPGSTAVHALVLLANGDLVAGGNFATAGGVGAHSIARWDGSAWSPLGAGAFGWVRSLAVLPGGDLVAGGGFVLGGSSPQHIARWDGTAWSALGTGLDAYSVLALAALPNGDLIAGGTFSNAGGMAANCVARWNGNHWSAMGAGMGGGILGTSVDALLVLENGDVVAGGNFTTAGGLPCNRVARWNGSTWAPLGGGIGLAGLSTRVYALARLPDGDVVVGGTFAAAGGVVAANLARWNGSAWTPLGAGTDGSVLAFATSVAGDLAAGGVFATADGVPCQRVARRTTNCPASAIVSGSGCVGGGGPTQLAAVDLPWLGGICRARATGLPPGALAVGLYGFTPVLLPLGLVHPLGVAGCVLRVADDVLLQFPVGGGAVDTAIAIPEDPALLGGVFRHQVVPVELDAAGHLAALTATNALVLTIGAL